MWWFQQQFQNCRRQLPQEITVYEMSNNDAWSVIVTIICHYDHGEIRGVDWTFNAWGLVDGLYFPWDQDDLVAQKFVKLSM